MSGSLQDTCNMEDMNDLGELHRESLEEELKNIFLKKENLESVRISAKEIKNASNHWRHPNR